MAVAPEYVSVIAPGQLDQADPQGQQPAASDFDTMLSELIAEMGEDPRSKTRGVIQAPGAPRATGGMPQNTAFRAPVRGPQPELRNTGTQISETVGNATQNQLLGDVASGAHTAAGSHPLPARCLTPRRPALPMAHQRLS
jgi:hypothetical protein